jgi:hypothetical protein
MRIFPFLFLFPAAFGQLFSAGLKIGAPLTDPFADVTFPSINTGGSVRSFSNAKKFIVGPMVELHLSFGFSINADGLYRPLRLVQVSTTPSFPTPGVNSANYASWEVTPALRYRFLHTPIVKPFAEAGPSFRFVEAPLDQMMSDHGFTLGGGVEVKILRLRVAPELRYTRWGSDHNVSVTFPFQTNQSQAEFLAGFSF